jgi:hypothetical protein
MSEPVIFNSNLKNFFKVYHILRKFKYNVQGHCVFYYRFLFLLENCSIVIGSEKPVLLFLGLFLSTLIAYARYPSLDLLLFLKSISVNAGLKGDRFTYPVAA